MGYLEDTQAESVGDFVELDNLIARYEDANVTLREAIENDLEDSIEYYDRVIAELTEQLVNFRSQTESAEKLLIKFLVRKFSLHDEQHDSLSSRASNRVLKSWLLNT